MILIPSGLLAYIAALWWRLRKIHRWEFPVGQHLILIERRSASLRPLLRMTIDGVPQTAINYREFGLASQMLGGGFKFEIRESGQLSDVDLWTDVDFLRLRLRCAITIDRGERKFLLPQFEDDSSRKA